MSPSILMSPTSPGCGDLASQSRFITKTFKPATRNTALTGKEESKKDRSKQFTSSSSTSKLKIICQYGAVSLFFAAYFIIDYLVTTNLLNNLQMGLQNKYY
jgi:hypothetical protein